MAAKPKRLSSADYARIADFRHALLRFLDFSSLAAEEAGLTPRQHQALLVIRGSPAATATVVRLAERLCLRPNTAAEFAQRLEAAGLIFRESCETDRRIVLLTLTPVGEAKLEVLTHAHRRELRQCGPEMAAFLESLAEGDQD